LPFINLSFGGIVASRDLNKYKFIPTNGGIPSRNVLPEKNSYFLRGGVGLLYRVAENIGVKFLAGYNLVVTQAYIDKLSGETFDNSFETLPNHLALSIGVRYIFNDENN
jgi:hypothetical protein